MLIVCNLLVICLIRQFETFEHTPYYEKNRILNGNQSEISNKRPNINLNNLPETKLADAKILSVAYRNRFHNRFKRKIPTPIKYEQDGSITISWKEFPSVCLVFAEDEFLCCACPIFNGYFLTSASCTSSISTGFYVHCDEGSYTEVGYAEDVKKKNKLIAMSLSYPNFHHFNLSRLRRHDLSVLEVLPFDLSQVTLKYLEIPSNNNTRVYADLHELHDRCYIATRSIVIKAGETSKPMDNTILIEVRTLSRDDCYKRFKFLVYEDEFCMIIYSKRNGPCDIYLGGPVLCGENASSLEGILTFHSPERCNKTNRIFLATRVDHYYNFIYDSMKVPKNELDSQREGRPEPLEPILTIENLNIYPWHLAAVAGIVLSTIVVSLAIFLAIVNRAKLKSLGRTIDPRVTRQMDALFNTSINLFLPFFLMISRIVLYCRLREAEENETTDARININSSPVVVKPSLDEQNNLKYQNTYPPP